jgi:hypothetical protein
MPGGLAAVQTAKAEIMGGIRRAVEADLTLIGRSTGIATTADAAVVEIAALGHEDAMHRTIQALQEDDKKLFTSYYGYTMNQRYDPTDPDPQETIGRLQVFHGCAFPCVESNADEYFFAVASNDAARRVGQIPTVEGFGMTQFYEKCDSDVDAIMAAAGAPGDDGQPAHASQYAMQYAKPLLNGLRVMHTHLFKAHMDIKPRNMLKCGDDIKLADIGGAMSFRAPATWLPTGAWREDLMCARRQSNPQAPDATRAAAS